MSDEGWDGKERRRYTNGGERTAMERHAQTVLATIVTLLVAWIGLSVVDLGKEQTKTSTSTNIKLEQLQNNFNSLQDQLLRLNSDRVTASDLRRIEDRLDRLEHKK